MNLLTYIVCVSIAPVLSLTEEHDYQHMELLSRLLGSIIKVNQERNNAMQKVYQLQDIGVRHDLRSLDEYRAHGTDLSAEQGPVLMFLLNRDPVLRTDAINAASVRPMLTMALSTDDEDDDETDDGNTDLPTQPSHYSDSDSDDDITGLDIENIGGLKLSDQQLQMLRKSWRGSCDKKAAKVCTKACKQALKDACSYSKCRKKLKKRFKKECKNSCKSKFKSGDSRSGSDSEAD